MDHYTDLKKEAARLGADLFGVCATDKLTPYLDEEIKVVAISLPFAVSLAVRLQRKVLETLADGPNLIYKAHYRQANNLLDKITFGLGQHIQRHGYQALPIPASVITDWNAQRSHLSHRHAAVEAGLGFWGRSGLVVNPQYGAAIRLATLLTDIPLHVDQPLDATCGSCRACVDACPVKAISLSGVSDFDGQACLDLLRNFQKRHGIGVMICGLCVKSCRGPGNAGLQA